MGGTLIGDSGVSWIDFVTPLIDHGFDRHVVHAGRSCAVGTAAMRSHDVHAVEDAAEDGVAEVVRREARVIERARLSATLM